MRNFTRQINLQKRKIYEKIGSGEPVYLMIECSGTPMFEDIVSSMTCMFIGSELAEFANVLTSSPIVFGALNERGFNICSKKEKEDFMKDNLDIDLCLLILGESEDDRHACLAEAIKASKRDDSFIFRVNPEKEKNLKLENELDEEEFNRRFNGYYN